MKNVTTSLYAVAKYDCCNAITAKKEYPVFKISHSKGEDRVTIINDNGNLESWATFHFYFIAKED
jgi:hypothetical protein